MLRVYGASEKLDAFIALLRPYGMRELVRSGQDPDGARSAGDLTRAPAVPRRRPRGAQCVAGAPKSVTPGPRRRRRSSPPADRDRVASPVVCSSASHIADRATSRLALPLLLASVMQGFSSRRRGFTLIELMIVIAILGVLAALAIPNFLRFQLRAKSSEGKTNLAAIRSIENAYFAEFNVFVAAPVTPAAIPGKSRQPWPSPSPGCPDCFDNLGFVPEGDVYFHYEVVAAIAGAGGRGQRRLHRCGGRRSRRRRRGADLGLRAAAGGRQRRPAQYADGRTTRSALPRDRHLGRHRRRETCSSTRWVRATPRRGRASSESDRRRSVW